MILATITAIGYRELSQQSRNSARIQDATSVAKIISSADLQQRELGGIPTAGRYCLSDARQEKRPVVSPRCGDEPADDPATYSQGLIDNLKKISGNLPASERCTVAPVLHFTDLR